MYDVKMNEKEQILDIIKNQRINFHRTIKKDEKLSEWVENNKLSNYDKYAQEIYSALYQEKQELCKHNKLPDFKGMQKGWRFCGHSSTCLCYRKWNSQHSSESYTEKSDDEKEVINKKREQTILDMTNGQHTNVMQISKVKQDFIESYQEKTGYNWPFQNPDVIDKISNTIEEMYGEGITNPSKSDEVKSKISISNKNKSEQEKKSIRKKKIHSRVLNGISVSEDQKEPFELYTQNVRAFSEISYRLHYYEINPNKFDRKEYHLDHIYSIFEGFKNNIPPYIIAHHTNLRMLKSTENISKNIRCDKTQEKLFEDFFSNR